MKKTLMIGGALATAIAAATAFAQMPPPGGPGGRDHGPKTRAEVQAKVAEHFKMLDTNKDGFVTKAEMTAGREAMRAKMGEMHKEHRDKMFAMLDKDGNGSISKAEFDAAPPPPGGRGGPGGPGPDGKGGPDAKGGPDGPGRGHGMRHGGMHGPRGDHAMGMMGDRWFDQADANKDGKVSLAEANAAALARFDKVDTNKDGTISPEERKAAFEAKRAEWKARKAS